MNELSSAPPTMLTAYHWITNATFGETVQNKRNLVKWSWTKAVNPPRIKKEIFEKTEKLIKQ
jgi:hypothetical protein